jgi:hypothetical protein
MAKTEKTEARRLFDVHNQLLWDARAADAPRETIEFLEAATKRYWGAVQSDD